MHIGKNLNNFNLVNDIPGHLSFKSAELIRSIISLELLFINDNKAIIHDTFSSLKITF